MLGVGVADSDAGNAEDVRDVDVVGVSKKATERKLLVAVEDVTVGLEKLREGNIYMLNP
jgi:hypothetical protein